MGDLLKGLTQGERFFSIIMKIGLVILAYTMFMTMLTFWFIMYQFYEPYQEIALFMVKVIGMSVKLFGFSALIVICLRIIIQMLTNIKLKAGVQKWKKKKAIMSSQE